MRFIVHLFITAVALWVAVKIVPGLSYTGSLLTLLGVALVFGVLNAIVKPILLFLSLPLLILSLGLFTLILNAFLLWLTGALSQALGLGFSVTGFWAAFLGAIVVSVVNITRSLVID